MDAQLTVLIFAAFAAAIRQRQLVSLLTAGAIPLAVPAAVALVLLARLAARRGLPNRHRRRPRVPGYELVSVVGTGADSVVYLARQVAVDRLVRLKRLRPGSPSQQAVIAARLGHANIAHIYTSFEHAGDTYVTGEYIDGPSLRRVVQQAGPLRGEQAMEVVCDTLEGLAYAHARGLSHGGLTPENVIVDHQGRARLVDFGQRGPATPGDDVRAAADVLDELFQSRPPGDAVEAIRRARADGPATAMPSAEEFLRALEKAALARYGDDWRSRSSLAGPVLLTVGTGAAGLAAQAAQAAQDVATTAPNPAARTAGVLAILLLVAIAPALAYRHGLLMPPWAASSMSSATGTRYTLLPVSAPPSSPTASPDAPSPSPSEPGTPQPGADGAAGSPADPPVGARPSGSGTPVPTSRPSAPSPTAPPPTSTPGPTPTPTPAPTPTPTPSPTPAPTPTPTATPTPTPSSTLTPTPTPS